MPQPPRGLSCPVCTFFHRREGLPQVRTNCCPIRISLCPSPRFKSYHRHLLFQPKIVGCDHEYHTGRQSGPPRIGHRSLITVLKGCNSVPPRYPQKLKIVRLAPCVCTDSLTMVSWCPFPTLRSSTGATPRQAEWTNLETACIVTLGAGGEHA